MTNTTPITKAKNEIAQANETLVEVSGLSKKFCKDLKTSLWYGVKDLISGYSGNKQERQLRPKEFWAVKDISFTLKRGECLGLIGHNGAGKSTLLKILNGLINPDEGKVVMKGRVGALIELGAGFNPVLSGRENIYNNGAILGFSRKEIDQKLQTIIDFAELQDFIDMPVRNYSSGMKVRLGFAVAAQMEPDVLIIDEVLAVGDAKFRAKCFNKISELSKKCAIIFVSHSMPLIGRVCSLGLNMQKGKATYFGNVNESIQHYFKYQQIELKSVTGEYEMSYEISLDKEVVSYMDDLKIDLKIKIPTYIDKVLVHYTVLDQEMKSIYQSFSSDFDFWLQGKKETYDFSFTIKKIDLTTGRYYMNIGFIEKNISGKNLARIDGIASFKVINQKTNVFASIVKNTEWRTK